MPRRRRQHGGNILGSIRSVASKVKSAFDLGKKIQAAHDYVKTNRYISRGAKAIAAIPGNPYSKDISDFATKAELRGYGHRRRRLHGRGAVVAHHGRMVPI